MACREWYCKDWTNCGWNDMNNDDLKDCPKCKQPVIGFFNEEQDNHEETEIEKED